MDYKKMFDLTGKTAIITGGGSGLGKEIATVLTQYGANIVVVDINEKLAEQTANELRLHGRDTMPVSMDVSVEEDVVHLVKQTVERFGDIDILVNNAGIMQKSKVEEMSLHDWQRIMDVNLSSVFLMSKYVGKEMIKAQKGAIINTASMSSFIANKEPQAAYNTSKAGVSMLTKCLASEWAEHNIRVNAIAPGYVKTGMTKSLFNHADELEKVHQLIPLQRVGKPQEVAGLVLLLASDASSYTTGSVFQADGGYLAW